MLSDPNISDVDRPASSTSSSSAPGNGRAASGRPAVSSGSEMFGETLDGDEVFRIIRERLADILEIDEDRITMEASFSEDLSADSLALIELVEALEQELEDRAEGFRIEDEDLADLRTVRDAVEYVVERVG